MKRAKRAYREMETKMGVEELGGSDDEGADDDELDDELPTDREIPNDFDALDRVALEVWEDGQAPLDPSVAATRVIINNSSSLSSSSSIPPITAAVQGPPRRAPLAPRAPAVGESSAALSRTNLTGAQATELSASLRLSSQTGSSRAGSAAMSETSRTKMRLGNIIAAGESLLATGSTNDGDQFMQHYMIQQQQQQDRWATREARDEDRRIDMQAQAQEREAERERRDRRDREAAAALEREENRRREDRDRDERRDRSDRERMEFTALLFGGNEKE